MISSSPAAIWMICAPHDPIFKTPKSSLLSASLASTSTPRPVKVPTLGTYAKNHPARSFFTASLRGSSYPLPSYPPTGRGSLTGPTGTGASKRYSLSVERIVVPQQAGKRDEDERCRRSITRSQCSARPLDMDWRRSRFTGVADDLQVMTGADCNHCRGTTIIRRGSTVSAAGSDNEYCDRSENQPHGACSFRRSSSPSTREGSSYVEVPQGSDPDQSGYTIKVSKELMGVFRYVEKVKRARIKELANTLKQTAGACMFFSCVRGVVGPLVEVFQTRPPSWGRLISMVSAFDSFAITYLALKASEPLEKLSVLATESEKDIMGSIEKEEEHMLALAVELVKLFRRLRNITVCTAVAQFASLAHSLLKMNNPKLVANATKIFAMWLHSPWN